ncbi:uncharacterized protein B0H18DRAFT_996018 [Fomitopsis serialis]|uniref:uncharacterized protein n=1 Tax=Fomitopsis serialis TaxID=139415 RepID=UPI002007EF73|nr:uncharacterized protein B0H18DRAFT_996018 [Neoantrodia serialis]KAH9929736.1 hypothetical protein B0H18DRAFT_996018 [Neoantrodia serialis]
MAKAKGKKTSLKAALSSQQSRLKKKQEFVHAEQAEKAKQSARAKGKAKALPPRPTIPFDPTDRILLIGEGTSHSPAPSFSTHLVLLSFYLPEMSRPLPTIARIMLFEVSGRAGYRGRLRKKGVQVLFNVDATKLEKCAVLKGTKWDKIVWNFPHAGKGITDQDRNILANQVLILDFLRSAAPLLTSGPVPTIMRPRKRKADPDEDEDDAPDHAEEADANNLTSPRGSILITLRNVPPYTHWDVPKMAKNPPPPTTSSLGPPNPRYVQLRSFVFHRRLWMGYEHRMTKGERAHGQGKTGEGGEDRTWQFCLAD